MIRDTTIGCPSDGADSGAAGDDVGSIQIVIAMQHWADLGSWRSPAKIPIERNILVKIRVV